MRKRQFASVIDGRILMQYEMRDFARYTVELFRAMKEMGARQLCVVTGSASWTMLPAVDT